MISPLKQGGRSAKLYTPFKGKDALVLTQLNGNEGLSELFEFRIEALSEGSELDFDQAIGKPCHVTYEVYGKERVFHGILVEAEWLGGKDYYYGYRLVLRPWLWLLSRTANCEIFQEKTATEIIQKVFSDHGFNDFELSLSDSYPTLDYCVQYRETDLAFVSRLMEQHGIYYFFRHTTDKHTLVLADSKSSLQQVPGVASLPFLEHGVAGQEGRQHLADWSSRRRFRTGKVEYNDYDHQQPTADLLTKAKGSERYNKSDMEVYDYPGKYCRRNDGEKYAKVLLEAEQAWDHRRHASGAAPSLFPGGLVSLEKHPNASENKEYIVVRAAHSISVQSYRSTAEGGSEEAYSGHYEFQPSDRPYRAPIVTPQPLINGIQTAIVVGPKGEEIHTDKYGRIKVQFYWDRDKKPSCWVRVAQVWSGKQWGGLYIPRIGMEVIVEFLEGDPDRPLVIGTVYNADYMPPYELPANQTQSGVKSNSSKGGSGYNEIQLEDKKNQEEINVHAQKDLNVVVLNDETRSVLNSMTTTIGKDFKTPNGSPSRKTDIKNGDDVLTIDMGNQETDVKLGYIKKTAFQKIELICGQSKITMTPISIDIESLMINIKGKALVGVQAPLTSVKGDAILVLKGGLTAIN